MDDRSKITGANLEEVDGFARAEAKIAMTAADGRPRLSAIDGVHLRPAPTVSHHHGHLTEIYRTDWGVTELPVVQVTFTTTFPGRVRAWGIHHHTVDRLFAATGSFCIVCYDGRRSSPTFGRINEFFLGSRNQGLVLIPPGVYHGWQNIGDEEAAIVSMPSQLYNYNKPDRWELPWDSPEAKAKIPYRWI